MNGLVIVSTVYAFLAAFLVMGKIRLHHRLKSQGITARDHNGPLPGNTIVDKEATDDFMDLMAVLLIAVAFFFELMNQFTNFVDWDLNHLVVVPIVYGLIGVGLVIYGVSTEIITTEYDNDSWTRALPRSRRLAILYFLLSLVGVVVLTVVLIPDAIATRSYDLLPIAWIPFVPLFVVLTVSTFAQKVFGRPQFTPKP